MGNNKSYLVRSDYSLYEKYGKWKEDYIEFLDLLNNGDKTKILNHEGWVVVKKAGIGPYRDPDIEDSRSYEFYEKLTKFLNIQENSPEYQLEGKYTYKFNYTKPYGIEVREKSNDPRDKNKEIESGPLFYLKSDQFGFSRPSTEHKHPYDSYLEKTLKEAENKEADIKEKEINDAKNNVAKWLYETRGLGGSFLWPMEQKTCGGWDSNPKYNTERGGTKFRKGGSYIEDRVDLTLLEIKQVMDYIGFNHPELEGNILWNCCLPETNMIKWLRHFMNFETYVEFFKFNDFVGEKFIPYDITTKTKTYVSGKRSRTIWTGEDKDDMDKEQLGNMFNNVAKRIKKRSKEMEDIVNETEEE